MAGTENGVVAFICRSATWLVSRELTQTAGPWDTRLTFDDDGEYFTRVVALSDGVQFSAGVEIVVSQFQVRAA